MKAMQSNGNDLFAMLKKAPGTPKPQKALEALFFQLRFDERVPYLEIVDKKGRKIHPNYRFYSGPTRDVLKSIEYLQEKDAFRINWEVSNNRIYLTDNPILVWQLRRCENFVSQDFKPIRFNDHPGKIIVRIEGDSLLKSRIILRVGGQDIGQFALLNESHVYDSGTIYMIPPIGENLLHLGYFATTILPADLEKYLSLLFSYFENIEVEYQNFRTIEGPLRTTEPVLLFEKIDQDKSLYLRISSTLPGFEPDFFENYDIRKIAFLNEIEEAIVVSEVARAELYPHLAEITRALNKYKKNLDHKNDYALIDNVLVIEENLARTFIYRDLAGLITRFKIFGAEKLTSYKVRPVTPRLNLSLDHGIDFLEGDASLEVEGQSIPLFEALQQIRKNAYIQLNDGTHAIINNAYISKLERIFKKKQEKVRLSFFDLPIVEELIDEKISQGWFQKSREIFLGFNRLHQARVCYPDIKATLRPYRKQGYKWLNYLHKHELGGCLADDMGLGKTLQAICILASVYPKEKMSSLIVMPRSLLFNWENEIKKFSPQLSYHIYYGQERDLEVAMQHQVILTTYALVRNDIEKLREKQFYYIILDESQNIKNVGSQISKAVMLLNAKHRLALSGTPIENNLGELYALFRFLNPPMFGSLEEFNRNYAMPIQKDNDKDAARELKKKVYPFILRRLKKDVLK
ncbi:MAG: hypothetical protein D6814_13035, partial [Calditrichaeota bacterium]